MKTGIFDGVRVVSTSELCERIGLAVSSTTLKQLNVCKPHAETSTGIYWKEDDVPILACGLAESLINRATILQISLNLNRQAAWA